MKIVDGITLWHLVGAIAGYFLHDTIYDWIKGSGGNKPTNPK
ncbi:MAG: hypothetical protein QXJ14_03305 [Candidatus Aenigmatarchaeota archaeon]